MHVKSNNTGIRQWPMSARRVTCILFPVCACVLLITFTSLPRLSAIVNVSRKIRDDAGDVAHDILDLSGLRGIMKGGITAFRVDQVGGNLTTIRAPGSTAATVTRVNDTAELKSTLRQDRCDSCFTHNFKYVIDANGICKSCTEKQNISLLILIFTVHSNWATRQAIRATWLGPSRNNTSPIRYAFLLGEVDSEQERGSVLKESEAYGDIIKEDFVDAYANLTYKTIMGLKWASTFCACAKFVMKTDDHMFVNVPNILDAVKDNALALQTSVGGACNLAANPIRDVNSKWFASVRSYPNRTYPGFCSGTGYVTSMRVASMIYQTSVGVPFFHLEDVYVALCVKRLGYKLLPIDGFHPDLPPLDPCVYKGRELKTSHQLSPEMLLRVWNRQCTA